MSIGPFELLILFFAIPFLFGAYFIPTIVAKALKHPKVGLIFLVNFLAGWSMVGWVAALAMVWLIKSEEPECNG